MSEEEEPVLIWSCDLLPGATGVSVDERRGLIYVGGFSNKTIYIINTKGECKHSMLKRLYCL